MNGAAGKPEEELRYVMDAYFSAIKKGDLGTVSYWACLCSHIEVLKYLLNKGAKYESCSPNGQRCFLAAQNPTIRDILHQKDQKINTKRKKKVKAKGKCPSSGLRYGDFLQRLFILKPDPDIKLEIVGNGNNDHDRDQERDGSLQAHSFLLYARSNMFGENLSRKMHQKSRIPLDIPGCSSTGLASIIKFLYTSDVESQQSDIAGVVSGLNVLGFNSVASDLEATTGAGQDTVTIKKDRYLEQLQEAFLNLALSGSPPSLSPSTVDSQHRRLPKDVLCSDVIFKVKSHQFQGHKIFFQERSEKFRKMLLMSSEDQNSNRRIVEIEDVQPETFMGLMCYIYSDILKVSGDYIMELLQASYDYALPLLTQKVIHEARNFITNQNAHYFYKTSIDTKSKRLTEYSLSYIRDSIEEVLASTYFCEFLLTATKKGTYKILNDINQSIVDAREEEIISPEDATRKIKAINIVLSEMGLDKLPDNSQDLDDSDGSDGDYGLFGGLDDMMHASVDKNINSTKNIITPRDDMQTTTETDKVNENGVNKKNSAQKHQETKEHKEVAKYKTDMDTNRFESHLAHTLARTSIFHFSLNDSFLDSRELTRAGFEQIKPLRNKCEYIHNKEIPANVNFTGCGGSRACTIL